MWGHANVAKWKITERKNKFYLAGLDPMTNSCRKRQLSLMPSAAYVSPIAHTPRGETHSYTQGCRLHNTSASWNPGQYYWLTQDTGSSQSSSWSDPVPCLLAPIFICLSLQSIIQQAVSDLPQIFNLLKLLQTKTHHAQNNFFARKKYSCSRYTHGTQTGQSFHSHAILWTRRIPSHMQEHTRNFHVTLNVKNNLKRCEIGVVSR